MGLGLIATACGIAKLASVKFVMDSKDPFWDSANLGAWAYVLYFTGTHYKVLIYFN